MSNRKRKINNNTTKSRYSNRYSAPSAQAGTDNILTSPYNFIDLNDKIFPAYNTENELPNRNSIVPDLLSGEIDYSLEFKTPIVFENGLTELTASTIRGLVRSNLQILGYTSLASDIEDDTYKFRCLVNGPNKKIYNEVMGATATKTNRYALTEYKNIRAGILRSSSEGYYIIPCKAFYGKGFCKLNIRKIQRENADWRNRFNVSWNNIPNIFDTLPNTSAHEGIRNYSIRIGKSLHSPFIKKVSWDGSDSKILYIGEEGCYHYSGYILNSGYTYGNVSLYLIPADFYSKSTDPYLISSDAIKAYKHHISKNKNPKDGDFYNLPNKGEEKPVFFIPDQKCREFGFTMLFPVSYRHSVSSGIPSAHNQGIVDYDKAIFGFKNKSGYYEGRVSFLQPIRTVGSSIIKENILLPSAKPNSAACYLINDDTLGYNSEQFELRGTKQYWLKDSVVKTPNAVLNNMHTEVSGYQEGTKFHGKILFYNLREDELGLLLWSIELNKHSQQNIGAGKQYGYGRVKITVDKVTSNNIFDQYASLNWRIWTSNNTTLDSSHYIKLYQDHLNTFLGGNLKSDNRLQGFFEMKSADHIPDAAKTTYTELRNFRSKYSFPSIKDVSDAKEWLIIPDQDFREYTAISWDSFYKNPPLSIKNAYPEGLLIEAYLHLIDLLELFRSNKKYVIRIELIQEYSEINENVKKLLSAFYSKKVEEFSLEYDQQIERLIKEINHLIQKLDGSKENFILSSVPNLTKVSISNFYNKTQKQLAVNLDIKLDVQSVPIKVLNIFSTSKGVKVWESNQTFYIDGGSTFPIYLTIPISEEDEQKQYTEYKVFLEYEARINGNRQKLLYEELIVSPISEHAFSILANPYSSWLGNPVSDKKMCFGRSELLISIMQKISSCSEENVSGRNIIIYGQKRTGKSTVLHFVAEALKAIPERYVVANIGNTASILSTDNKNEKFKISLKYFFARMVDSIESSLELNHENLFDELEDENFLFPKLNRMSEADAMSECSSFFERLVNRLAPDKRIVLLIDEFTYFYDLIIKQQLDEGFMRFWKAFIQNTRICAILIGQDFMDDFRNAYPNEFGASDFIRISYLDKASTEQLIRTPFERENGYNGFSAEAVDRIYTLTSGNAFFTMNICSKLVEFLNEEKNTRVISTYTVNNFLKTHWFNPNSNRRVDKAFFESLYNDGNHQEWDDDNLLLLYSIAEHCNDEGFTDKQVILSEYGTVSDANGKSKMFIPFCKEKIDHLIYREVLSNIKGRLYIKVQLFAEWLLARYSR